MTLTDYQKLNNCDLDAIAAESEGWVTIPRYCTSRDLAYEFRKGFTPEEHSKYGTELARIINGPDCTLEKLLFESSAQEFVRKMADASARDQMIAAIMVKKGEV